VGVILDTSVLIAWERQAGVIESLAVRRPHEPVGLSTITASELLHGVHRAETAARRLRRSAFVEKVLASFPLYDFDLAVARIYAELWAVLERKGLRVSAHDLIIGSTAVARGDSVITLNRRDFDKIPGLRVEVLE
jgi:tRNA(fMet)-specific endonuclease VapC